jgi:mono/diheme cytochrome c family protein
MLGRCGGGGTSDAASMIHPMRGDPDTGSERSTGRLRACHALEDAGSLATIGPDLDQAQPSNELAVERMLFGKGQMNSFRRDLSDQEIADIAAYVVFATTP